MPLSQRRSAPHDDQQAAELGVVQITVAGVNYRGTYRVGAEGNGRQRYAVTANKRVTVSYGRAAKATEIGTVGLEQMAATLLQELVSAELAGTP